MRRTALQLMVPLSVTLVALPVAQGHARLWRVERDGTADFSTLQPAVDAAASGDTILIGPGDYTEFAPFPWDDVAIGDVFVGIRTDDLTLIGADRDLVRIGPLLPDYRGLEPKGIAMKWHVANRLKLRSLTVRNVRDGLYLWDWADVRDVQLVACVDGASIQMDGGLLLEDCVVTNCLAAGIVLWPPGQDQVISRCEFAYTEYGVAFVSTLNGIVRDCSFHDVVVGVQFQDGATGTIERCSLQNVQTVAVAGLRRVDINLQGNRFLSGPVKVDLDGQSSVTGSRNVFSGSNERTFWATGGCTVAIHESHFLPGAGQLFVLGNYVQDGAPIVLDLTNNYWGGADSATVAEKIWDGNDDPTIKAFVQFSPMLDHPVPAAQSSFGGLKARFGGGGQ